MRTLVQARGMVRSVTGSLVAALLLAAAGTGLSPASGRLAAEDPPAAKGADAKAAKKRTEPRGRLPAYFSEVISAEQREKIYDLQSKFSAQISKLQDEITTLEETRDKEVMAVLSAEQAAKVKALQDEAKAKRAANAGRKKGDGETPAAGGNRSR